MAVDDVFMDTMSAMVTGKFSKPRTRRRARRRPTRRSPVNDREPATTAAAASARTAATG
jgi:hypothetical protein